jgi:PAS domain S-box-containing protein
MHQSQVHPKENLERAISAFREVVTFGCTKTLDIPVLRQDGQIRPVDISATIIDLEDKQIIQGIFRDITERKQAQAALRKSENKFRKVFESNVVGMVFATLDGEIIDANNCFLEMLGYTKADLEADTLNCSTLTPPEYKDQDLKLLANLRQNVAIAPQEKAYYHKDGHLVHVLLGGITVLADEVNTCFCVIVDISDRKKSENALKESQQFLQTILDSFPLAVFWKDRNSVYLGCNQQFTKTTGLSSSKEVINKTSPPFLSYSEAQSLQWQTEDQEIMSSGIPRLGVEQMITTFTQKTCWIESNKVPLHASSHNS